MEIIALITGIYLLGVVCTMVVLMNEDPETPIHQLFAPEWVVASWIGFIYIKISRYIRNRKNGI